MREIEVPATAGMARIALAEHVAMAFDTYGLLGPHADAAELVCDGSLIVRHTDWELLEYTSGEQHFSPVATGLLRHERVLSERQQEDE